MYGLPISTEIKKQLPKKAIYAKFDLKASQREAFDADVARMDIVALVSPKTGPAISEGETIKEFYLLAVQLKRKNYDAKNIALLSKLIPQNILFALQFGDKTQLAIYHTKLICSEWKASAKTTISITGLNLDAVWENIVIAIGNIQMNEGNTVVEQIQTDELKIKLKAQIETLQKKLNKEKQLSKQLEINAEIKSLRKQLLNLK